MAPLPGMAGWGLLIAYRRSDADNRGLESNSARIESRWGRVMISVEVYQVDDTADEAAAVRALQEAKGLDDHYARKPFGLLYWHKRPFSVPFASAEEAGRFIDRLRSCGYHCRLTRNGQDPA